MPYVERRNGVVVGLFANPQPGYAEEFLIDQDPEVEAIINPPPSIDDYKLAIVAMLDSKAQERRYDGAVSISTYVGSTNPQWAAEAQAYVAWRDRVWTYAYAELDKVLAGQRPQPTVADLLGELPDMVWPPEA